MHHQIYLLIDRFFFIKPELLGMSSFSKSYLTKGIKVPLTIVPVIIAIEVF
jgi:hypothetical protein